MYWDNKALRGLTRDKTQGSRDYNGLRGVCPTFEWVRGFTGLRFSPVARMSKRWPREVSAYPRPHQTLET